MWNKRKGQRSSPHRGQSTVEYIILVSAVLAVAILFLTNSKGGFQEKLNQTLEDTTEHMNKMAGRLTVSTPLDSRTAGSGAPAFSLDMEKTSIQANGSYLEDSGNPKLYKE